MRTVLLAAFMSMPTVLFTEAPAMAADTPGNDSCATASPTPGLHDTGTLDSTDTRDFYSIAVVANQQVHVEMNPGYAPTSGKNYDLYLWSPACTIVASSTFSGITIETINHFAAFTGLYYMEVRRVSGSGFYDIAAWTQSQPTKSCSDTSTPALLTITVAACSLSSQVCATGACAYRVQATAQGIGAVSSYYMTAACSGLNNCTSAPVVIASSGFTDTCTSAIGVTVAETITVRCTVSLL